MLSLTTRLLLAASVLLITFLSLTGYALDKAYQSTVLHSVEERLQNHVFTLIAVAEFSPAGGIHIPQAMPVARFFQFDDGVYARIIKNSGESVWQSMSVQSIKMPAVRPVAETQSRFEQTVDLNGRDLFNYEFGVSWDQGSIKETYTINILESLDEYRRNVKRYREELGAWFSVITIILLVVLTAVLRWSLAPLRKAEQEIKDIKDGRQDSLLARYPRELQGLTDNINGLIQANRVRLERYRNASADLAHSLKTPLALLQGAAESEKNIVKLHHVIDDQVERMNQIVNYQLQRAATTGQAPLAKPVLVKSIIEKIVKSLDKVYSEKGIQAELNIQYESAFFGDKSDFMELMGNVLDNAYKWAKKHIRVSVTSENEAASGYQLCVVIEDDGPGIDPTLAARVMHRGVRSDGQGGGTGIGLAVVTDIINAYQGKLEVSSGSLGGARFMISFFKQ